MLDHHRWRQQSAHGLHCLQATVKAWQLLYLQLEHQHVDICLCPTRLQIMTYLRMGCPGSGSRLTFSKGAVLVHRHTCMPISGAAAACCPSVPTPEIACSMMAGCSCPM